MSVPYEPLQSLEIPTNGLLGYVNSIDHFHRRFDEACASYAKQPNEKQAAEVILSSEGLVTLLSSAMNSIYRRPIETITERMQIAASLVLDANDHRKASIYHHLHITPRSTMVRGQFLQMLSDAIDDAPEEEKASKLHLHTMLQYAVDLEADKEQLFQQRPPVTHNNRLEQISSFARIHPLKLMTYGASIAMSYALARRMRRVE